MCFEIFLKILVKTFDYNLNVQIPTDSNIDRLGFNKLPLLYYYMY